MIDRTRLNKILADNDVARTVANRELDAMENEIKNQQCPKKSVFMWGMFVGAVAVYWYFTYDLLGVINVNG